MGEGLMSRASPDRQAGPDLDAYVDAVLADAPEMTPAVRHRLALLIEDQPDAKAS